MTDDETVAITPANVAWHLSRRGLISAETTLSVQCLSGGISNDVLGVETSDHSWRAVVKQALRRLRVDDEWIADPRRITAEADGLRLAARLTPDRVPVVLDLDRSHNVLVITRAPENWTQWKADLLRGHIDPEIAELVGRTLAVWHTATYASAACENSFGNQDAFRSLRIDPFYYTVARRVPEVASQLQSLVRAMARRRLVLVHGDLSPKNILCAKPGLWVIDWEVVHFGDPAFDLAYLLSHLLCKAAYKPALASDYMRCAQRFLDAYSDDVRSELRNVHTPYVTAHVCALAVARICGISRVEYLDRVGRERIATVALPMLQRPTCDPLSLWQLLVSR